MNKKSCEDRGVSMSDYDAYSRNNAPQTYDEDGDEVCSECGCLYHNYGDGTMCAECRRKALIECELDYYMDYEY